MNIGTLTVLLTANTVGLNKATIALRNMQRAGYSATTGLNAGMNNAATAAVTLGRSLTQFVTIPLGIIGGVATKTFSEFEYNLAKIEGLVGVAEAQTKAWGESILQLSKQVGKGPVELADALYFITSSGFDSVEAMEILEITSKAAAAGLGEVKYVADVVTSAMNAYRGTNLTAARATDVLVATIREGKGEVDKMVASMGVALPIASKLGVGMEQVGAAMAAMTRTGTTVATSAVQTRQLFNSLLKPAQQSREAIASMGSSYEELRNILKQEGLDAMLKKLMEITNGNTASVARLFPNIRALNGIVEITGDNFETFKEILKSVDESTGDTDEAFRIAQKTLKQQLNVEVARFQVMMVRLGNVLKEVIIPLFRFFVNIMEGVAKAFDKLPFGIQQQIALLGVLAAMLGPIILLFKGLSVAIGFLRTAWLALNVAITANPIGGLIAGITLVVGLFASWTLATRNQTKAQKELNEEIKKKQVLSTLPEKEQLLNQMGIMSLASGKDGAFYKNFSFKKDAEKAALESLKGMSSTKVVAARQAVIDEMVDLMRRINLIKIDPNAPLSEVVQIDALEGSLQMYRRILPVMDTYIKQDEEYRKSLMEDEEVIDNVVDSVVAQLTVMQELAGETRKIATLQKLMGNSYNWVEDKIKSTTNAIEALAAEGKGVTAEMTELYDSLLALQRLQDSLGMKKMTGKGMGVPDPLGYKTQMNFKNGEWVSELVKMKMPMEDMKGFQELLDERMTNATNAYMQSGKNVVNTNKVMLNSARDLFTLLSEGGEWHTALKESFLSIATLQAVMFEQIKNGIQELANSVLGIFTALGEGLGNAMAGEKNPFDVLVEALLSTVKTLGKILIGLGAIMILANPLMAPLGIGLMAAGIAATALAQYGAAKNAQKTSGANMADGGIIPPGYPNDTFKANLSSQEAVIPLERIPQLLGINRQSSGTGEDKYMVLEGRVAKALVDDARMMKKLK